MQAATNHEKERQVMEQRSDFTATQVFLQETQALANHIIQGPVLRHADIWVSQATNHWSRTLRALKHVFRIRHAKENLASTESVLMCVETHDEISKDSLNAIRESIRDTRNRLLGADSIEHVVLAGNIAITIQRYCSRVKDYLVNVHTWDQAPLHNCECCAKNIMQQAQQSTINELARLSSAYLSWQPLVYEDLVFTQVNTCVIVLRTE